MDIQLILIFVGSFLVGCLSLFLVYKFGIKEKSYEEAIAEQRQHTRALLGIKPKPKEKKNKKAAKKIKEKERNIIEEAQEETDSNEVNPSDPHHPHKLHVEFKEVPEELPPVKENTHKKKVKKERIRPILVNKESNVDNTLEVVTDDIIPINHFEEIHPKDEFELMHSNSREDLFKPEPVKEKTKPKLPENESSKKKSKNVQAPPVSNPEKEKPDHGKKKNNQQAEAALQVVELEKEKLKEEKPVEVVIVPQTNGLLGNVGKEKKKKKSEFNTLQQLAADKEGANVSLLLNLVRKAELSRSEVQILIDLLLNKQHEAPAVVDEWSEGKSDPVQKLKKQLAEKEKLLQEEQQALIGAQAKLREVRAEQQAERAQQNQKLRGLEEIIQGKQLEVQTINNKMMAQNQKYQQMQAQYNEEHGVMQMKIQQYEIRLAQTQDAEAAIAQLRAENQDLSAQNQHLRIEFQRLTDENLAEKEGLQSMIMQLNKFQEELKQKTDHIRHLEERSLEVQRNLELTIRKENDFKIEISHLKTKCQQHAEEIRRMAQEQEELKHAQKLKEEADKLIAQLRADLQKSTQLQETQANGSSDEIKSHKVELLNLRNELTSLKTELQQKEKKHKTELDASKSVVQKLETELSQQKDKNNELRTKNWKLMEALNTAESRIKSPSKSAISVDQITSEVHAKELEAQKQFLLRLFPEISELKSISASSDEYYTECGKLIKNYISGLQKTPPSSPSKSTDVQKLQQQVAHYKNIIDETEGILNRLQSHIEQEEISWRSKLQSKDEEIESLKEKITSQLQAKVSSLEKELQESKLETQRLQKESVLHKSQSPDAGNAVATIEKLTEEVNHLSEQLRKSQLKQAEPNNCLKAQNYNSTNGPSLVQGNGN